MSGIGVVHSEFAQVSVDIDENARVLGCVSRICAQDRSAILTPSFLRRWCGSARKLWNVCSIPQQIVGVRTVTSAHLKPTRYWVLVIPERFSS